MLLCWSRCSRTEKLIEHVHCIKLDYTTDFFKPFSPCDKTPLTCITGLKGGKWIDVWVHVCLLLVTGAKKWTSWTSASLPSTFCALCGERAWAEGCLSPTERWRPAVGGKSKESKEKVMRPTFCQPSPGAQPRKTGGSRGFPPPRKQIIKKRSRDGSRQSLWLQVCQMGGWWNA